MKLFGLELTRAAGGLSPIPYSNKGGWWPNIREPFSGAWQRNITWTTDTVLAHHAVYACITRIAQDIGKLRPQLMEQDEGGIWAVVSNTAHSPVIRKPNRFQNHIQFKEWWATSKLTHGNTYVLLERDNREVVSAMYVLDSSPGRVQVLVAPDGSVFYNLKTDNLAGLELDEIAVPASEIIHDRINCLYHPLVGTSPIFACGVAANMGLQIQQNQSGFFANGSNPSGILSSVASITPDKSKELSEIWNARFSKGGSGGVAVLGDSMKFEPMRMNAVDSQLIQQLQWTAETVCSTFHVPPWKIGIGPIPQFTRTEFANQSYYSDCLQSPIEQWELCMDEALGFDTPTEGRYLGVELDLDGLLRMDAASQITTLKEAVSGSIFTVNEARAKVDLTPVDGGDSIWMQQQNYSLEALAKRDEKADPFATGTAAPPGGAPDSNTPALPAGEPQKQLPAGQPDPGTIDANRSVHDLIELVGGILPGVKEYVDGHIAPITTAQAELSIELRSLRTELETRNAEIPEVVTEPEDSLEMWDGWFARDSLAIVREAQALELRVVQESIESDDRALARATLTQMSSALTALATRDTPATVVNVAAPQVHIAPSDVKVELTMQPEAGKTVIRHSEVIRDDVGSLIGVKTTEVKE